jgi:hypothetical protein
MPRVFAAATSVDPVPANSARGGWIGRFGGALSRICSWVPILNMDFEVRIQNGSWRGIFVLDDRLTKSRLAGVSPKIGFDLELFADSYSVTIQRIKHLAVLPARTRLRNGSEKCARGLDWNSLASAGVSCPGIF